MYSVQHGAVQVMTPEESGRVGGRRRRLAVIVVLVGGVVLGFTLCASPSPVAAGRAANFNVQGAQVRQDEHNDIATKSFATPLLRYSFSQFLTTLSCSDFLTMADPEDQIPDNAPGTSFSW